MSAQKILKETILPGATPLEVCLIKACTDQAGLSVKYNKHSECASAGMLWTTHAKPGARGAAAPPGPLAATLCAHSIALHTVTAAQFSVINL